MAHFLLGNLKKVLPLEDNLTTNNDSGWVGNKAQDGKGADALAAGTLTNQAYAFTFVNMVGKSVISSNFPLFGVEIGSQVFNFEYCLCDCRSPRFFI
jgi:hypothetical protein